MTVVAERIGVEVVHAAIIDPPIGRITLGLTRDSVTMRFSDGEVDRVPREAVRAIERCDRQLTVNWAGTTILLGFPSAAESAAIFDELGGFDLSGRTFTILVTPAGND